MKDSRVSHCTHRACRGTHRDCDQCKDPSVPAYQKGTIVHYMLQLLIHVTCLQLLSLLVHLLHHAFLLAPHPASFLGKIDGSTCQVLSGQGGQLDQSSEQGSLKRVRIENGNCNCALGTFHIPGMQVLSPWASWGCQKM